VIIRDEKGLSEEEMEGRNKEKERERERERDASALSNFAAFWPFFPCLGSPFRPPFLSFACESVLLAAPVKN